MADGDDSGAVWWDLDTLLPRVVSQRELDQLLDMMEHPGWKVWCDMSRLGMEGAIAVGMGDGEDEAARARSRAWYHACKRIIGFHAMLTDAMNATHAKTREELDVPPVPF